MSGPAGPGRLEACASVTLRDYPVDAAWAPDGRTLLVGLADGALVCLQIPGLQIALDLPAHTQSVLALGWQKAGRLWASSGQDGRVLLWDARTQAARLLHAERQWSERLAFAERGSALAVASGRTLRVFDEAGQLRYEHGGSPGVITALAWHPRAAELAGAGNGGVLLHRIAASGPMPAQLPGRDATPPRSLPLRAACVSVAFHPEGRLLAAGLQEGTVQLWNLSTGSESRLQGHGSRVWATEWSSTGRYLATVAGSLLAIWDFGGRGGAGPTPLRLEAHSERITAIGFRPAGPWLASAALDRRLLWWRIGAGDTPQDAHLLADECSLLRFSRDGALLAAGDASGRLSLYRCLP
ncbi:MAG TPA: WD40 repeat domain-containing protein [Steroidobacteraceae bacterium]|nr:WD40 repeat domain-containing protein [Steroidobacteraceae bacterium]